MNSDHIVKFNHNYSKLHVYDTDGKYELIDGKDYIQLVFLGDKEIPFTTYREFNEKNRSKYFGHVGEVFEFEIEKVN